MTRRIGYQHRVRVDGRVARIDAIQAGVVRVRFRDKTERLVSRDLLSIARNDVDRPTRTRRAHTSTETSTPSSPSILSRILSVVCTELGIASTAARRRLRKAGLHAPYNDETAIRTVLKCIQQEKPQ